MARGVKQGDAAMRVLPGYLFPFDKMLHSMNRSHFAHLDGYNVHLYSWAHTPRSARTGWHPESRVSNFGDIIKHIRFRDLNLPRLPVYVTEFGWDSAGAGEDCDPEVMPTCVSEHAQAVYLIRATLMFARLGVQRATVFFYANTDAKTSANAYGGGSGTFSRSGLTGSSRSGFRPKASMFALEGFVAAVGDLVFLSVLREDDDAWVHLYGTYVDPRTSGAVALSGGIVQQWVRPTHVIAWRPVNGDDKSVSSVRVSFDNNVFLAANYPRLSLEAKPTHQGIFLHSPGSSAVTPDFASARGNAESAWLAVTDGDVKASGDERLSLSVHQPNKPHKIALPTHINSNTQNHSRPSPNRNPAASTVFRRSHRVDYCCEFLPNRCPLQLPNPGGRSFHHPQRHYNNYDD